MNIIAEYEQRLAEWSDIQGHIPFLRETAASYTDPVIIELGVRSGESTSAFLAGIAAPGGHLWSADVNDPVVPEEWHRLPYWHFLKADDCSPEALSWLPAQCDILFIDTSHERDHTDRELRLYMPRVKPGGVALFHDTLLAKEGGEEGRGHVWDALDAWCAEMGRSWENRPGSFGMGVVRF